MNDDVSPETEAKYGCLPPSSNRTLHHPSFLPLYMAVGSVHYPWGLHYQQVPVMTPTEFFYSDPTMHPGRRMANIVSDMQVFECLHLNTPPPIMSACLAPPIRPDPFTVGPHPTRDLGCSTWRRDPLYQPIAPRPKPRKRGHSQAVIQLTLEEDQAITSLLKLHYQDPVTLTQKDLSEGGASPVDHMATEHNIPLNQPQVVQSVPSPIEQIGPYHRGQRSSAELEAANALLTLDD